MAYKHMVVAPELGLKQFLHTRKVKRFAGMDVILTALEFLFGCWHRKISRPFTLSGWTYEVCLNCGKKFAYNRAEIGCGVPKQEEVGHGRTSWHETHRTASLVAERQ